MSLLDELQRMYGQGDDPTMDDLVMHNDTPNGGIEYLPNQMPDGGIETLGQGTSHQPGQLGDALVQDGDPDIMKMFADIVHSNASTREASGGGAPAGMTPASVTQRTETGGVPPEVAAQGVAVRGQAEVDNASAQQQMVQRQSDRYDQQAQAKLAQAQAEDQKRQREEAENAARQQRLRSQQMDLAKQNDEPVNPNRYFENMGIASKASAIISAAIYGYLNPRGGGQAPVVESLMQMAHEDTQAQIQNIRNKQSQRAGLMEQYDKQYGDTTLVAKRLEADKLLTMGKMAEAQGLQAKSADAKDQADLLAQQLKNRVGVLHQEIQEATYGKPVESTTTYKPTAPKGSGMAEKYDKAAKAYQSLAAAGMQPEERLAALKAMNLPTDGFGGKTADEQKFDASRADAAAKAKEINPTEKVKLIEKVDGLASAMHGFAELDDIAKIGRDKEGNVVAVGDGSIVHGEPGVRQFIDSTAGALPFGIGKGLKESLENGDPEDLKAMRRAVGKITAGMAHAESGAGVNEEEMKRYENRMPLTGAEGFKRGSAEMIRETRQKYNNLVGQYGKEETDSALRARGIDPRKFWE